MKLLEDKGYTHQTGNELVRKKTEVMLVDDLRDYLRTRYADVEITEGEIDSIILSLRTAGGSLYEANKAVKGKEVHLPTSRRRMLILKQALASRWRS